MVRGLELFREHFAAFAGHYIIIGGTACDLLIDGAGFTPRATKDFDIILVVEALSPEFVKKFWEFVKKAGYQRSEKSDEKPKYYRFQKPTDERFPFQLELFARVPDVLTLADGAHLTPIPVDEDLSSLSAILMDDNYYNYTLINSTILNDIHLANSEALICLKAKAFLEMKTRERNGEKVDSKHIRKHKADIFRLVVLLPADGKFDLPEALKSDLHAFAGLVKEELPDSAIFKEMGIGNLKSEVLLQQLRQSFGLEI
jgi:hypothetical protein